jgi:SAM-dependent methyltransferase
MFREPHAALGGRSYGEAFAEALLERGLVPPRGGRAIEVGGGVGFFALRLLAALRARAPERAEGLRYAILDLSQVLQDSQRMLNFGDERIRYVLANAARGLPLAADSVDLVISNEVIADFTTVRLRRADLEAPSPPPLPPSREAETIAEARAFVRRHALEIDDAPEVFWLNYGALRFVEEVARVLRPGGAAVLVEFGGLAQYPIESTHLSHSEFSIHFGHLAKVAEDAGLSVELTDILQFLGMRGDVRVLAATRTFFECLRALLERRGVALAKLAYSEEDFRALAGGRLDPSGLRGVVFKPVRERALGLRPPEFVVAVLRKPLAR